MDHRCDCERGGNCTRTTMCHVQSVVDDLNGEHEIEIERLEELTSRYSKTMTMQASRIDELTADFRDQGNTMNSLMASNKDLHEQVAELESDNKILTEHAAMDKDFILQYQSQVSNLTDNLKMEEECFENLANDFKRVESENRKLRYVMETAQTMRDDYESYNLSEDGTYGTELFDPEILKDLDDAIKEVSDE